LGYPYGRRFGSKITLANWKEGYGVGVGPFTKQVVKGNDPHVGRGQVYGNFCPTFRDKLSVSS
jgi:hypothetical protein